MDPIQSSSEIDPPSLENDMVFFAGRAAISDQRKELQAAFMKNIEAHCAQEIFGKAFLQATVYPDGKVEFYRVVFRGAYNDLAEAALRKCITAYIDDESPNLGPISLRKTPSVRSEKMLLTIPLGLK